MALPALTEFLGRYHHIALGMTQPTEREGIRKPFFSDKKRKIGERGTVRPAHPGLFLCPSKDVSLLEITKLKR